MVDGAGLDGAWRLTAISQRKSAATAQQGIKRLFEQALLILLLSLIIWAFLEKARDVRDAAELSAVQANLGAMRSAMVIHQMHRQIPNNRPGKVDLKNPFLLLADPPANYAGEVGLGDALAGKVQQGYWFYDQANALVGYRLRDDQKITGGSTGKVLLFQYSKRELLTAREAYVWRGVAVN